MAGWERTFRDPKKNIEETRIPVIDKNVAAGFRLQTEERVARDVALEAEAKERNKADIQLREEMYTFGMVACGYFDPETKDILVVFPSTAKFTVKGQKILFGNYTDKAWTAVEVSVSGQFNAGEEYWFKPYKMDADGEQVTAIYARGLVNAESDIYLVNLTITRPIFNKQPGKATLEVTLVSAFGDTSGWTVPVKGNVTTVSFPYENLKFFK